MYRFHNVHIGVCAVALVLATAGVAGCSGAVASPSDLPTGSEEIVIQFSGGGGNRPGPCCFDSDVPYVTVYGDGRVVFTEHSAGQAPEIRQATMDRDDLAGLLAQAKITGLLGDPDTGGMCCDMGYTRVILGYAGERYVFSVIGLGLSDSDLTFTQRLNRYYITALQTQLDDLVKEADRHGEYEPTELAAYIAFEAKLDVAATPWPLPGSLAEAGTPTGSDPSCLHVTAGSQTVVAAARTATTPYWSSAGRTWYVIVRPLLPHEHGCP